MNIIQHNGYIDFDEFFRNKESMYKGRDYQDFLSFFNTNEVTHSFTGCAEGDNRVTRALEMAIKSEKAENIILKATSAMIVIFHSSEAKHPLIITEIQSFISVLPATGNFVWELYEDYSLRDMVKVIVLINTPNL